MLEDHSHVFADMVDIGWLFSQIITIHCDVVPRYLLEEVKATEECGFTRTRRTDDADNISFIKI